MVPSEVKKALDLYVSDGLLESDFVSAVLENNLVDAVAHADQNNQDHLQEIVQCMYWEIPHNAWGSKQKVAKWIEKGGLKGS